MTMFHAPAKPALSVVDVLRRSADLRRQLRALPGARDLAPEAPPPIPSFLIPSKPKEGGA